MKMYQNLCHFFEKIGKNVPIFLISFIIKILINIKIPQNKNLNQKMSDQPENFDLLLEKTVKILRANHDGILQEDL